MLTIRNNGPLLRRMLPALLAIGFVFAWWIFLTLRNQPHDGDVNHTSESIGLRFERFEGRIYVNIAFQGYYLLPGADASTFQSLSVNTGHPLGKDRNAVFCGTQPIPGLQPDAIRFVEQGYVSDGSNTWFCSLERDNPDYRWWHEFTHHDCDICPDKPRKTNYFLTRMEGTHAASLRTTAFQYAYDDQHIYYEGRLIAGSDAISVKPIHRGFGHFTGRESEDYLRDRNYVYFQGRALSNANPEYFSEWIAEGGELHYGLDGSRGQFYIGASPFPRSVDGIDSTGLKALLFDRERGNHELFYNANGIWYWDYKEEELKRACANPFSGNNSAPRPLAAGIWADQKNTFVSVSLDIWRRSKGGGRGPLKWRITELIQLPGIARDDWTQVEELAHGSSSVGTLWRANGVYYFTSEAGSGHFFNDAIYLVKDVGLLRSVVAQGGDLLIANKTQGILVSARDIRGASLACEARYYYPQWF